MLLILLVLSVAGRRYQHHMQREKASSESDCPYSREDAVAFARRFFDRELNADGTRGDGYICAAEIDQAESALLNWWESILAFLYSTKNIVRRCDCDGDGYISLADFHECRDTCLHDCSALGDFDRIVRQRALSMKLDLPPVACE